MDWIFKVESKDNDEVSWMHLNKFEIRCNLWYQFVEEEEVEAPSV